MAIGVSMMVGWEFYEFTMDRLYGMDLQHALPNATDGALDTMIDLILGSTGALIAMFVEAFRRVGLFGEGKEERRAAYRLAREEAKRDKLAALQKEEKSAAPVFDDDRIIFEESIYTDEEIALDEEDEYAPSADDEAEEEADNDEEEASEEALKNE